MKSNTTRKLINRESGQERKTQAEGHSGLPADPPMFEGLVMTAGNFMSINVNPQLKQAISFKEKSSTLDEETPCLRL